MLKCLFLKKNVTAYLRLGDYNVIVADWSEICQKLNYDYSASYTKNVGKSIAKMVDFLVSQGLNSDTLTIIGHSLGAHVAGLAGYYANTTVNYIIGKKNFIFLEIDQAK